MINLLLTEHIPSYTQSINQYIKSEFDLEPTDLNIIMVGSLPRDDGKYLIDHLVGTVVTDYWQFKSTENVRRIDDMSTISDVGDIVASHFITPKVWYTDEVEVAQRWLAKYDTFDIVACDFEAKNLTLPPFNPLTMVTISWNLLSSTVFVFSTNQMQQLLLNWLITTDTRQVWHNCLFDIKHIHYHTGKFPKHIEDSQLLAAVYNNDVDVNKRKSGLKAISGPLYGDWAQAKTSFDLYDTSLNHIVTNLFYVGSNPNPEQYNLALIKYCGIDACATKYAWQKYATEEAHPTEWIFPTSEPQHNTEQFNQRYYYEFVVKPAIPMVIEMMNNGQAIDLSIVDKLKAEVDEYNTKMLEQVNAISIVQEFQSIADQARIDKFLAPVLAAWKHPKWTGYKNTVAMRTFVVNYWDKSDHEKITAANLKSIGTPIAQLLMAKQFTHPAVVAAACVLETAECLRQNTERNRVDKVANPGNYVTLGFNQNNYPQLADMWEHFGLESDTVSKDTGKMSFSSDVLKRLSKETDGDIKQVIDLYLEIAQSKNMITQYIPKYYGSTVNGRLHYSLKLMGTISGRLSGKAGGQSVPDEDKHMMGANGVTQPVGHRVYGKTVKSMFIAPPGRILAAVDYNGLTKKKYIY